VRHHPVITLPKIPVSNITERPVGTSQVVGIEVVNSGGTIVQRKHVTGVNNLGAGTFGAYGINIASLSGNNVVVRNNFIGDITGTMTGGSHFRPPLDFLVSA
jgi:hypothetical protein